MPHPGQRWTLLPQRDAKMAQTYGSGHLSHRSGAGQAPC